MPYDLKPMKAPRAAGALLKTFTVLVENPITSGVLANKLLGDAGILHLRDVPTDCDLPSVHPIFRGSTKTEGEDSTPELPESLWNTGDTSDNRAGFESVGDFARAYRDGSATPVEVAERVIEATRTSEALNPAMRIFIAQNTADILAQAKESTQRIQDNAPIGPLDGVPVAVKDELDQVGYPTTVGTRFLGKSPAMHDAEVVRRLRAQGAVLIGKANMHEVGMGVTGLNPHHGSARNPYDPSRCTGGSSSGSAAAVAMGLCPLAVGADGGGSIRIPSGLTGIFGLKATFGRISEHGAAPLCWTLAHVGPMAATAADMALGYLVMAGRDPRDANTAYQPDRHVNDFSSMDLKGLKLGIFRPWFDDSSDDVRTTCYEMLDRLKGAGAELVDVTIDELALLRTVHLITIISEMATSHLHHYAQNRADYGLDVRLNLKLARTLATTDYVHAQRHRVRLCDHFYKVLEKVDGIVTPTTACTAPALPADALKSGESNLAMVSDVMRYAAPANLTGLPGVSFPAGYDKNGLPIGFQVMGRPWEEHTLLRIAHVAETILERKRPKVQYSLLDKGSD